MTNSTRISILLFLALTVAFSSLFWALAITTGEVGGGHGSYALGMMWSPGMAALLTCRLRGLALSTLGWSWGAWRWQALSYLWPLGVCVTVYGVVWLTGLGGFPNPTEIAELRKSLGWPHASGWQVAIGWFFLLGSTGEIRAVASALGEEIGWRGFLAPRLDAELGFTKGALLTGAIWAVWHFPILLGSNYDNATPVWFAMPCFIIEVLSLAIIMSWVRLRSGSLWTGAVAHGSINLFNQGYFAPLTTPHGRITAFAIDESGAGLPIALAALAFIFWIQRDKCRPRPTTRA